ncbi:MAG: hypothetical protein GY906_22465 [bacterium]|nr:hypothetical protein [bacterium]
MTIQDVIGIANREGMADANFDLSGELRYVVVPQFLRDIKEQIGETFWQVKPWSTSIDTTNKTYSLPSDWKRFRMIKLALADGTLSDTEMSYIGDRPERIIEAENSTEAVVPAEYYIVHDGSGGWEFKLAALSNFSTTIRAVYEWLIPFTGVSDPDLDEYMPNDIQGLLVTRTRMLILADRLGEGDPRYSNELKEYQAGIVSLSPEAEPAPRRRVISMN